MLGGGERLGTGEIGQNYNSLSQRKCSCGIMDANGFVSIDQLRHPVNSKELMSVMLPPRVGQSEVWELCW